MGSEILEIRLLLCVSVIIANFGEGLDRFKICEKGNLGSFDFSPSLLPWSSDSGQEHNCSLIRRGYYFTCLSVPAGQVSFSAFSSLTLASIYTYDTHPFK